MQSNTLKVTISGSYKKASGDVEDFENVTGIIPRIAEDKAQQMVIRRYAFIWVGKAKKAGVIDEKKYPAVQRIRQVFIDSIDDTYMPVFDDDGKAIPGEFTDKPDMRNLGYVGKNIMDMNAEDLQDLAAAKDLSSIPLYRAGALSHARRVAWSEYARKVLGWVGPEYIWTNAEFNPAKHEPIVADGSIRRDNTHVADIEETIERENLAMQGKAKPQAPGSTDSKLTLDQLKAIADNKKINYHKSIGWQALHDKVFAKAA